MDLKKIWSKHSTVIVTYAIAFLLLVFVSVMRPGYASANNLRILSATAAVLGITVMGQTVVILIGGMDLSIPWMFTIGAFLMANLSDGSSANLILSIPVTLLAGLAMGLFNGFGIAYAGIAPVIMTMASNIIFQGLLVGITGGTPGAAAPDALKAVSTGGTGAVSWLFLIFLVLSAALVIVLGRTPYGRKVYAVGNSETVADFAGINSKAIKVSAYALSGVTATLAGLLYAGRLGQLYLGMGDPYQMQSVSAVAIGGISLLGGSGSYVGAVAGVLILVVLDGVLSAMNIPQSMQKIIYGAVLFMTVLISSRRRKRR